MKTCRNSLAKTKERKNRQDDYDSAYDIDNIVHCKSSF